MRYIDLFCGIGGFHQALKRLNFECVYACDIDKECRKVYETNYNITPDTDITKAKNIPDFDILCGGFPCQSFSNSGKKKAFEDTRGNLINYVFDIIKNKKPMFIFLENVKHILKINEGKVFEYIITTLTELGYIVKTTILSPHQFGIPQQRERVFFICVRKDLGDKELTFEPTIRKVNIIEHTENYKISNELNQVLEAWDEIIQKFDVGEKLTPIILVNEFYKEYTKKEFNSLPKWKQDYILKTKLIYNKYKNDWDIWYAKYKNILSKKEIYAKLEWQTGEKKENDSIFNNLIQMRQSGIRVKRTNYFPTLVAIGQIPIYGKEKRYLSPRECARLQSFPEDFIIHQSDKIAYKQFGNSVNVDVVHFVINTVLEKYNII
jgi:DNA (cytosine-5)-methyltransferase 1